MSNHSDHLFTCAALFVRNFLTSLSLRLKFSIINNALCQVFVVSAKKELESCCTYV